MTDFVPLPQRRGMIHYRDRVAGLWGTDEWTMTMGADGIRVLSCFAQMRLGADHVVRDSVLSVHPDFHPNDAYVRIRNHGRVTGTGWFRFSDDAVECESFTAAEGRISQRVAIERPLRGFGIHALQGDAWLGATFPYEKGPGHEQFFGRNLLHSTHHLGATGPMIATTGSGLRYHGLETVTVPAGTFECHRLSFVGFTNDHPPYNMWLSTDGDYLYIRGTVDGYMNSDFELVELEGGPLG